MSDSEYLLKNGYCAAERSLGTSEPGCEVGAIVEASGLVDRLEGGLLLAHQHLAAHLAQQLAQHHLVLLHNVLKLHLSPNPRSSHLLSPHSSLRGRCLTQSPFQPTPSSRSRGTIRDRH